MWLSNAVKRSVTEAGAPLPLGRVQYQGVDCALFAPGTGASASANRPLQLLFVGRLHPSKGPDVAIDALAEVRRRGRDAELVVVGEADDPGYLSSLQQHADGLGLTPYVTWRGKLNRDRLPDAYRSADVFVFVSRLAHEGQGLTYLEAMACGVPVVAAPSGGAFEFLTRYPIARLAVACNGTALADQILLVADDRKGTQQLTADALITVRRKASLNTYIDAVEAELRTAACGSNMP